MEIPRLRLYKIFLYDSQQTLNLKNLKLQLLSYNVYFTLWMLKSCNISFKYRNSHFDIIKSYFDIIFCTKISCMTVKQYKTIIYWWMNLGWEISYRDHWQFDLSCTGLFVSSIFGLNRENHTVVEWDLTWSGGWGILHSPKLSRVERLIFSISSMPALLWRYIAYKKNKWICTKN